MLKNKNFKTEFELFFANKDSRIDVAKKYSELFNKLIKKYSTVGLLITGLHLVCSGK